MSERRKVSVRVYSSSDRYENFGLPELVSDWPAFIAAKLEGVPEFARASVSCDFDISGDDYGIDAEMSFSYERPETDLEYATRSAQETEARARHAVELRNHELKVLAALKAKYER